MIALLRCIFREKERTTSGLKAYGFQSIKQIWPKYTHTKGHLKRN